MREKLIQQWAKLKEINSRLSKRNRILAVACVAAVLIIAASGAFILNSNSGSTSLFTDLTPAEATEILDKLREMGVTSATYNNNKGTIFVPASQEDSLRAELVLMGYPKSGLSYEVFRGNVDMMSTDLDRETYKLYDLQDRIASTIRHFKGVYNAVVFISTGSDSRYVMSRDRHEPSASVTVFMQGDGSPTPEQVNGIKLLVAKAVPGMSTDNVAVMDGFGNPVAEREPTDQQSGAARLRIALERDIERSVQSKIHNLLNPLYGADRVRVSVNCSVDVTKKLRELIEYRPYSEDSDRGVLQSSQTLIEAVGQGSVIGGVPGTETNAQIPIYPNITSDGSDIYYTDERAFQYLVTQLTEQIQDDGGDIIDLSVGVVVGHERLSRTEKEELRQVVAQAAGINIEDAEQKVAIVAASFYDDGQTAPVSGLIMELLNKYPMLKWILLAAAALLLVIIVVLILLLRRARKNRQEKENEEIYIVEDEERAEEDDILNTPLDQARKTREQELKQQIGEFADMNPEIAAQLIKTWLKGGTGDD